MRYILFLLLCVFIFNAQADNTVQINPNSGPTYNKSVFPLIAMNNSGQAIVAWSTQLTQPSLINNIYVSSRNGSSSSWSSPKLLSTGASHNNAGLPIVAINDSGQSVIIWFSASNALHASFKNTFSSAWSAPQVISTGLTLDDSVTYQLSLNQSGEVLVSFSDADKNIYIVKKTISSGGWSTPKKISTGDTDGNSTSPSIVLNDLGQAIVTWSTETNRNIYVSRRKSSSAAWSAPQLISRGTSQNKSQRSRAALNNFAQAVIAFDSQKLPEGTSNVWISSSDDISTSSWSQPILLSTGTTAQNSVNPQVSLNNSGQTVVAWAVASSSFLADSISIYASTRNGANAPWSKPQPVSERSSGTFSGFLSPGSTAFPAALNATQNITLNESGQIGITWSTIQLNDDKQAINPNIYLATRSKFTAPWSSPLLLSTNSLENNALFSTITSNNKGELILAWQSTNVAVDRETYVFFGNIYSKSSGFGITSAIDQLLHVVQQRSSIHYYDFK